MWVWWWSVWWWASDVGVPGLWRTPGDRLRGRREGVGALMLDHVAALREIRDDLDTALDEVERMRVLRAERARAALAEGLPVGIVAELLGMDEETVRRVAQS